MEKKKRPFISVTTLLDVSGRNSHRAVDEQLYLFQSRVLSRQSTAVPVTPVALLSVAAVRTEVHFFLCRESLLRIDVALYFLVFFSIFVFQRR